jgi:hypothetical protein
MDGARSTNRREDERIKVLDGIARGKESTGKNKT